MRQGSAQQIDRSFFERNASAKELRDLCISFIKAWNELSQATGEADRAVASSKLEGVREQLIESGVTPNMHTGQNIKYFQSRPVAAAQYCAGQLLNNHNHHPDYDAANLLDAYSNVDDTGAHSISSSTDASILSAGNHIHAKVIAAALPRAVIATVTILLDAHDEIHRA